MKKLVRYFINGIAFIAPLALTALLFYKVFNWVYSVLTTLHVDHYTILIALGLSVVLITAFGFLASTLILKPFSDFFNRIIKKIPILNFVYASLKDMTHALVGEKNKFSNPVMIQMGGADSSIYRLGFMTQQNLEGMKLDGMVSVFVPISYSYTGNMYVIKKERVTPIDAPAVDVFKLIFTGGVTNASSKDEVTQVVSQNDWEVEEE